ncbi:hypothetical protein [Bradyrhizobium sp. RT10b]|uniref:hypothetical protein n=1 Tax=Bradyrhizobium sp. RT10b TaxID=3156331 RepID=UPI003397FFB3
MKPIAKPAGPAAKPVPRGNPLWSVPLSALTAIEERPIFSASAPPAAPCGGHDTRPGG